jgi:hypothetical protein
LYSADNDGDVMVKSSIRFKNAGESLIEILKSLTSSMYILYIPVGWKWNKIRYGKETILTCSTVIYLLPIITSEKR